MNEQEPVGDYSVEKEELRRIFLNIKIQDFRSKISFLLKIRRHDRLDGYPFRYRSTSI